MNILMWVMVTTIKKIRDKLILRLRKLWNNQKLIAKESYQSQIIDQAQTLAWLLKV